MATSFPTGFETNSVTFTNVTTNSAASTVIWTAWNDVYYQTITSTVANSTTPSIISSVSTTAATTTNAINQIVWDNWNNAYTATITTSNVLPLRRQAVALSPEEVARRREESLRYEAQRREERIRYEAEQSVARERAEKLLRNGLSPKQCEELAAKGFFTLELLSKGQRKFYRIERGRSRNVKQVDANGRVLKTLCAHPYENVPDADTMLAQKLWLETAEEEFLRVANHS